MMRLFNRFYALCAIAVCTILYSAWFLTSRNFGDIVPLATSKFETAAEFDRRLVVFGDSWSDNETEEPQGKVWTDWLCEKVSYLASTRQAGCQCLVLFLVLVLVLALGLVGSESGEACTRHLVFYHPQHVLNLCTDDDFTIVLVSPGESRRDSQVRT